MNKMLLLLLGVALAGAAWLMVQNNKLQRTVTTLERELQLVHSYVRDQKELRQAADATSGKQASRSDTLPQSNQPSGIPVKGDFAISQRFSATHTAVDFAAPQGAEVVASAAGEVASVYWDDYFGNVVLVDHLNQYLTMYAHLSVVFVQEGDAVQAGETLALVGNTGNSSAPHLHFEIVIHGESVDPLTILAIDKGE
jgi:murein DD-endopeptidase MepM/ murein hydrolase activator NlpD